MQGSPEELLPPGVELIDPMDIPARRKRIFDSVKDSFARTFPRSYGGVRIEVADLGYEGEKEFTPAEEKKAKMHGRRLSWRLRGSLRLFDEKTGELLDEKRETLARVPYLTNFGTFSHGGNDYATLMQLRVMPGPYARRRKAGDLEAQFNVKRGTGPRFSIRFEPQSGIYRMDVGGSSLNLYSVLRDIGIGDDSMREAWGDSLLEANASKYDRRALDKAYEKILGRRARPEADREEKAREVAEAFRAMAVNPSVLQSNLPNLFSRKAAAVQDGSWEKAAFFKLARYGAGVIFRQPGGKYLLERNTGGENKGKLRPAGGGKSKRDCNLRETIVREIGEEFGIPAEEVRKKIRKLGYIPDGKFRGCALYEMADHGLKPGVYHASNSKTETVKLEEASLDDPDYIGPKIGELLERQPADTVKEASEGGGRQEAANCRFFTEWELRWRARSKEAGRAASELVSEIFKKSREQNMSEEEHRELFRAATQEFDKMMGDSDAHMQPPAEVRPAQKEAAAMQSMLNTASQAVQPARDFFREATDRLFEREGWDKLVNDPADRGGLTRWGISQRAHPDVDIRSLTRDKASEIYRKNYWPKGISDPAIAEKIYDMRVNMGASGSGKIVQRAANRLGKNLQVDGIVGSKTLEAINSLDRRQLMEALIEEQRARYLEIIQSDPSQARFRNGWMNRANFNPAQFYEEQP